MILYHHPLSGHSHRVRLFLSLIGVDAEERLVDLAAGEHKSLSFLHLNPLGQVPVLQDGQIVIADSAAILVYLARKYDRSDWLPADPLGAAEVQRWLSIAAGQIAAGPAGARLITVFKAPYDAEQTIAKAHAILRPLDRALADRAYLLGDAPTLADVAIYSYVAKAPEGNVSLADYAHIRAWLNRIEALPGFVAFQSTPVGLAA